MFVYKRHMPNELQNILDDYLDPDELVPSDLLLNEYHPYADEFQVARREIEQKIFAVSRGMKPQKREVARLIRTDMTPKDIAKKLSRSVQTIYKWAKDPDVVRLATLLDYQAQQLAGPQIEHRKGILWRIILDNEEKRPNVSVQAIQEFNKMDGVYATAGNTGNQGNVVNIQINGEILPRGPLDQLPETYETKVIND